MKDASYPPSNSVTSLVNGPLMDTESDWDRPVWRGDDIQDHLSFVRSLTSPAAIQSSQHVRSYTTSATEEGLTTQGSTGQITGCLFLVFQNRSRLEFASSWPKMPMWFIGGLCYTTLQNSHYWCGFNPSTKSPLLRFKGPCDAQTPLIKIQFCCWLLCNSRAVGRHHEALWCSVTEFQFYKLMSELLWCRRRLCTRNLL